MTKEDEHKKKLAGEKAIDYIQDGMKIGLGSGSTVNFFIKKLAELVKEGLKIEGIPSSVKTEKLATELGIPLTDFSTVTHLDVTVDGANEVDEHFNLIKGGGGSLLREKFVATASKKLIIIVDEAKLTSKLGSIPLPVEVVPFAWEVTSKRIAELGCTPTLRKNGDTPFVSDNGNYILDCQFNGIADPDTLHNQLKLLLGVVETGLFVGMTEAVIVAGEAGTKVFNK